MLSGLHLVLWHRRNPLPNLVSRNFRCASKHIVIGGPNQAPATAGRAFVFQPAPHPRPGHNRIDQPAQLVDRNRSARRKTSEVAVADKIVTAANGGAVAFVTPPRYELINVTQRLWRRSMPNSRIAFICDAEHAHSPDRHGAIDKLHHRHEPGCWMPHEAAREDYAGNAESRIFKAQH